MSRPIAAKITGVAGYVPPKVVTNADLEKIVDTSDEWIRTRTGIRERRYAEAGVGSSDLGVEAARKLLAMKNLVANDIDMMIVATVTPDMLFPATACLIQDKLGAKKAWGFDLSAACSGFAYALTVGAQLVAAGSQEKVLVIGSDVMTSILDFRDRATCVLFGDGAGASAAHRIQKAFSISHTTSTAREGRTFTCRVGAPCNRRPQRPWPSACITFTKKVSRFSNMRCDGRQSSPARCSNGTD